MMQTRPVSLKRRNYLIFLAASQALAAGSWALAGTYTWTSPTTGGNWSTAANWSPTPGATGPTTADTAQLNNSTGNRTVIYDSGAPGTVANLSFTQTSAFENLLDDQKTINVTNAFTLGASGGGISEFFIDPANPNGNPAVTTKLTVPSLILNSGGVLEMSNYQISAGYTATTLAANLNITGGTLYVDQGVANLSSSTQFQNVIQGNLNMTSGTLSMGVHASAGNAASVSPYDLASNDKFEVTGNLSITGGSFFSGGTVTGGLGTENIYLLGATNVITGMSGTITPLVAVFSNGTSTALSLQSDSALTGGLYLRNSTTTGPCTYTIGSYSGGTLQVGEIETTNKLGLNLVLSSNITASNSSSNAITDGGGDSSITNYAIDTNGHTLNIATTSTLTPYGTTWAFNNAQGSAAVGTVDAGAFNFASAGGGVTVAAYVNLVAIAGNSASVLSSNLSGGAISANSTFTYAPTFNASTASTFTSNRSIGNLTVQSGTLVLASNISMGTNTTATVGGTLNLSSFALTTPNLAMTGGTLLSAGSSSNITATNISSGTSVIKSTAGTLALAGITRNVGATVDFTNTGTSITTSTNNTNGILGGYATVAGTDWATSGASGTNPITALPAGSYTLDGWASGNNTTVTTNDSPASGSTTNSLRFNNSGANTITLSGTNTITSGGILVTSGVGNNVSNISGGTLEGSAGGDLVVIQNNTNASGTLIIGSQINDNTSATGLTKSGAGTLILTGANGFTGTTFINAGTLQLGDGTTGHDSSLASSGIVDNGVLTFDTFASQSYANPITGSGSLVKIGTNSGGSTLTLSAAETYSGGTNVSNGTLIVTSAGSLASGSAFTVGSFGLATLAYTNPTLGVVSNANPTASALNFNATTGTATLASISGSGNTNFASNATIGSISGGGTINIAGAANFNTVTGGILNLNGPTAIINTNLTLGVGGNGNGTITLGNTILTIAGGASDIDPNPINGANGSLVITGGSLKLYGANTYGGGTNVSGGTLIVGNGSSGSLASGSGLIVGANGTATVNYSATLGAVSNANTSTSSLNFNASTGTVNLASLSGVGNTNFASNVTVNGTFAGGTATVAGVGSFGNVSSGTLNLNGATASIGILNGGTIRLGTTALTVSGGGTSNGNINGTNGSLIVSGGTLNLSGVNTYGGSTTITGGSLVAGSATGLSSSSAFNVSNGILDASGFASTIGALTVGATGQLNLTAGAQLTSNGVDSFAVGSTLDLLGTPTVGQTLITYTSESGSFTNVLGALPGNEKLSYGPTALTIVTAGPASLTWNNAGGSGDGTTWDTVQQNWNNGTGVVAYSDTSNSNISAGDIVAFTDANNGHYNVSIPATVHPTSVTVTTNGAYMFNGSGGIAGPGSLALSGSGSLTLNEANSYAGGTNVSGGTLILGVATALPGGTNLTIGSGAEVFANNLGSAVAFAVGSLSLAGKLDLNNNALVVHNSSIGAVTTLVNSGFNSGAWNGPTGIISTAATADTSHLTALGVIQNSVDGTTTGAVLHSTFENQTGLSATDVLVKYTYYGDANLDGKVDGTDYSRIDSTYLAEQTSSPISGWYNGDFNYDNVVNGSDYTLIDNAFNSQGSVIAAEIAAPTAQIAAGGASSAVPEPTTLGLLGIGALGLLGRRNRRRN